MKINCDIETQLFLNDLNKNTRLNRAIEDARHIIKVINKQESLERHQDLQSLIFSKESFSREQALEWVKTNKYRSDKIDETETSFRFRQRDPGDFEEGSFRTVPWPRDEAREGIKAIVGKRKRNRNILSKIFGGK
jgi:hypothetical protein